MHESMYVGRYACMQVHMYESVCMYVCSMHICVCACIYVCMYKCIYLCRQTSISVYMYNNVAYLRHHYNLIVNNATTGSIRN